MNWLILLYFIELGYSPFYNNLNVISDDYEYIRNENVYYVELNVEAIIFDHLFIGGSTKTFIQPNVVDNSFSPIENDYLFRTGLRYKNLEVGFNHLCVHPSDNFGVASQGKSYGGYQEIYIRISNEF